MGTITPRTNAKGELRYKAEVRIRRDGALVYQETQTFARKAAAEAWMKKRETEMVKPGALAAARAGNPTLAEVIEAYITQRRKPVVGDKLSVLRIIQASDFAKTRCAAIDSGAIYAYAETLAKRLAPSTVGNYLAYLKVVFETATRAWKYPLDLTAVPSARDALREMGLVGSSERRDYRPTLDELDRVMDYLRRRCFGHQGAMPMDMVVAFAIFSTRRLGEIARLHRSQVDVARRKILVTDMKDPRKKSGNNVWVDTTPEAIRILQAVPNTGERFFPYTVSAMSDAFKEARAACSASAELTFHNLRHDGISRLFEIGGLGIPQVAAISGHKRWENLQRYTHLAQSGDKYAGWPWLDVIAPLPQRPI